MYKKFIKPKTILKTMLIIFAIWLVSGSLQTTFSSDPDSSDEEEGILYNRQYEIDETINTDEDVTTID